MSSAFSAIQYQGKSNSAGHQMDRGRRKQRATHPCVSSQPQPKCLLPTGTGSLAL